MERLRVETPAVLTPILKRSWLLIRIRQMLVVALLRRSLVVVGLRRSESHRIGVVALVDVKVLRWVSLRSWVPCNRPHLVGTHESGVCIVIVLTRQVFLGVESPRHVHRGEGGLGLVRSLVVVGGKLRREHRLLGV